MGKGEGGFRVFSEWVGGLSSNLEVGGGAQEPMFRGWISVQVSGVGQRLVFLGGFR